jgi:ATP-dependent DNA helicase RecG
VHFSKRLREQRAVPIARSDLITTLLPECGVEALAVRSGVVFSGKGVVPRVMGKRRRLSGRDPIYRLIDDAELLLTIWAAQASDMETNA